MFNRFSDRVTKATRKAQQDSMASTVNIKLLHGLQAHDATVPCFLSFGQLKETVRALTGVPIEHIKLNFKGREPQDDKSLAACGVKNGSRIFVGESDAYRAQVALQRDPAPPAAAPPQPAPEPPAAQPGWEQFPPFPAFPQPAAAGPMPQAQAAASPLQPPPGMSPLQGLDGQGPFPVGARAPPPTPVAPKPQATAMTEAERSMDAIGRVAAQVDELQGRMQGLPAAANTRLEAAKLVEALTQKLLQLDGIDVTPATRQARKDQINRINALCDQLELLKAAEERQA